MQLQQFFYIGKYEYQLFINYSSVSKMYCISYSENNIFYILL